MTPAVLARLQTFNRLAPRLNLLKAPLLYRSHCSQLLERPSRSRFTLNVAVRPVSSFSSTSTTMAKSKPGFYAVRVGRKPGVYTQWDECLAQVQGHPKATYKKFTTITEAREFAFPGSSTSTSSRPSTSAPPSDSSSISFNKRSVPASPNASSAASKKKVKAATTYSHTALSVIPSTLNLKDGYWRTASGRIVVYTDGSSLGNGKKEAMAGLGVYWGEGHARNVSERVPGSIQTNNRGELLAIIRAIETAADSTTPLEIRTDSQYCVKALKDWLPNWRKRGWKTASGDPVLNKDLIQHLASLVDLRRGSTTSLHTISLPSKDFDSDSEGEGIDVGETLVVEGPADKEGKRTGGIKFTHVKAHVGLRGNEEADTLANLGALLPLAPVRVFGDQHAKLPSSSVSLSSKSPFFLNPGPPKKGSSNMKAVESDNEKDYELEDPAFWGQAAAAASEVEARRGIESVQPKK